jgi:hypothetical protein
VESCGGEELVVWRGVRRGCGCVENCGRGDAAVRTADKEMWLRDQNCGGDVVVWTVVKEI